MKLKIFLTNVTCLQVFMMILLTAAFSTAQTNEESGGKGIVVIGASPVIEGNMASARNHAIAAALNKGVEKYLIRRLGTRNMALNFSRLINVVLPGSKEGIENFHILAEDRTEKRYRILVRLRINENVLQEKLRATGIVMAGEQPVRILFLVSHSGPGNEMTTHWWKNPEIDSKLSPTDLFLHGIFEEYGFNPINRLLKVTEGNYTPEMTELNLEPRDAAGWGKLYSADIVMYGKSAILEKSNVRIDLAAIDVEKALVVARDTVDEPVITTDSKEKKNAIQALEKAIRRLAMRIGPAVIRAVGTREKETSRFEIVVTGLNNLKQFRELKTFLTKNVRGVNAVMQTKVSGGAIYVMVTYSGTEAAFLEDVSGHEKLPFDIEILKTEDEEIFFSVK
ncbi:MAG: hypothetical protein JRJ85_05280 [Deltaproteobacteria bacterium]|nr:hypothetical protein [Deltaproteobacteria bacterium]